MKIILTVVIAVCSKLAKSEVSNYISHKYHGPIAYSPGYDKYGAPLPVLDTPEVAHAKALQISAIAKAGGEIYPAVAGHDSWSPKEEEKWSSASQQYAPTNKYYGPIAYSPGYDKYGAPLPVVETPEVLHAKAQHFAAYAKAAAANSLGGHHKWKRSIHDSWSVPQYTPYHGPIAYSPGYDKYGAPLPVLDTPEVAHAKAEHLAAVAKAGGLIYPATQHHNSYAGIGQEYGHQSSFNTPQYAAHNRYHGPIAYSPGYDKHGAPLPVLETPEVAHAKAEHYHIYTKTLANLIAQGLYDHQEHHDSW